jgi:hypothetical protein
MSVVCEAAILAPLREKWARLARLIQCSGVALYAKVYQITGLPLTVLCWAL